MQRLRVGKLLRKFVEMVSAQGGDSSYIEHPEKFPLSEHIYEVLATSEGYISHIDSLTIGTASMKLGGGRETYDDVIDMSAGIVLNKKSWR